MEIQQIIKPPFINESLNNHRNLPPFMNYQEVKINNIEYERPGNTEILEIQPVLNKEHISKPFIEANTDAVNFNHLKNECIIPVFSKDNEKTIAHQEFIEIVQNSARKAFPYQNLEYPEIRVSHQIAKNGYSIPPSAD